MPRRIEAGYGPVITSAVRVADAADPGDGRGSRLLSRGRGLSRVRELDPAGRRPAFGPAPDGAGGGRAPGQPPAPSQSRHRHERRGLGAVRRRRLGVRRAASARHGPGHPGRQHVAGRRSAAGRLEQARSLEGLLRPRPRPLPPGRRGARRRLQRRPALVPEPGDHGALARRLSDGQERGGGGGRRERSGLQPPGTPRGRRIGDAGTGRAEPEPDDRGAGRPLRRRDHRPGNARTRALDGRGRAGAGARHRPPGPRTRMRSASPSPRR